MNKSIKTSLNTKFLAVIISNFILLPTLLIEGFHQGSPIFKIIQVGFICMFTGLFYALFVANLWEIFENNSENHLKNKLCNITLACSFSTIIYHLYSFYNLTKEAKNIIIICTAIEIFLIFFIEKGLIYISKNKNLVNKIAECTDNCITVYIYAILFECVLSWLPNLHWDFLPLKIFWHIVGPYMDLFTLFVPRIVGIDFSPILAIAVLIFIKQYLHIYFKNLASYNSAEDIND